MKTWKKILITIGIVLIGINLYTKVMAPVEVIDNYIENNEEFDSKYVKKAEEKTPENKETEPKEELTEKVSKKMGLSKDMTSILLMAVFAFGVYLVIAIISDKNAEKAAPKKKK